MKSMKRELPVVAALLVAVAAAVFLMSEPVCGNGIVEGSLGEAGFEECDDGNGMDGDGCSASCMVEFPERIYVAPYMGNIDGEFSEEWFFFYGQLVDYFDAEGIPVGATVYPATIDDKPEFAPYIRRIYESDNMELVQKAWTGLGEEQRMDNLSLERQEEIIYRGREAFRESMAGILGIDEDAVSIPLAYNQPQGRFTNDTRQALEDLGFRIFFEMYMNDDLGPVESSDEVLVLQYGVGMTTDGDAGRDTEFFTPGEVLLELRDFYREDLNMIYVNGSRVVPVWCHHMDFESKTEPNTVDQEKWDTYTYVMGRIKEEPNLVFVSPSDVWKMVAG